MLAYKIKMTKWYKIFLKDAYMDLPIFCLVLYVLMHRTKTIWHVPLFPILTSYFKRVTCLSTAHVGQQASTVE